MALPSQPDPVAQLLEMGLPQYARDSAWPDYRTLGIGPEHVFALIGLALNRDLLTCTDESDPHCWAPVHAWRALGQLGVQEAIAPLLHLFHEVPDNDWVIEEMPTVFRLIGPAACPALTDYLRDPARPAYSRLIAATSLTEIARAYPATRDDTVATLVGQLVAYKEQTPGANGVLIANLVELRAAEHSELIQKVFSESKVDRFITGDWRDVKHRLRGQPARPVPNPDGARKTGSDVLPDPPRPAYREPHTSPRRNI